MTKITTPLPFNRPRHRLRRRDEPSQFGCLHQRGQTLVEFSMVLPLLLLLVLGVIEVGYALYENHLIIKLAREGSSLISRQSTLQEAENALLAATTPPISFDHDGKLILSVIRLGTGGGNLNRPIIAQRRVIGTLSAGSVLGDPDPSAYNGAPNYVAQNADNDTRIRIAGALPNGLTLVAGQSVYITEVYTRHNLITPFERFGAKLPSNLYASAYF
jgi:hypothetical protein